MDHRGNHYLVAELILAGVLAASCARPRQPETPIQPTLAVETIPTPEVRLFDRRFNPAVDRVTQLHTLDPLNFPDRAQVVLLLNNLSNENLLKIEPTTTLNVELSTHVDANRQTLIISKASTILIVDPNILELSSDEQALVLLFGLDIYGHHQNVVERFVGKPTTRETFEEMNQLLNASSQESFSRGLLNGVKRLELMKNLRGLRTSTSLPFELPISSTNPSTLYSTYEQIKRKYGFVDASLQEWRDAAEEFLRDYPKKPVKPQSIPTIL